MSGTGSAGAADCRADGKRDSPGTKFHHSIDRCRFGETAMAQLHSVLPPDSRLIAMIHDEFIVECPDSRAEEVRNLMIEVMQTTPENFKVPMIVEAKIASNWGDAK
ncbi:MAG: hypothetical protein IPG76_22460 [Acidobacteria bacterium]|nr:hypothetical protein [Acidobacteriota bacterium]